MDEKAFYSYLGRMFKADPAQLGPDTHLRNDLHLTSQQCFSVSTLIEKLSGKQVSYADINGCNTLGEVIELTK